MSARVRRRLVNSGLCPMRVSPQHFIRSLAGVDYVGTGTSVDGVISVARAAVQEVVAGMAAVQKITARAAIQNVGSRSAVEMIAAIAADECVVAGFNAEDPIVAQPSVEHDRHCGARAVNKPLNDKHGV